jgi:membrane protein DedA with SNARE-associated domain
LNLQQLIADYGYYAVFFGSLLEGETVLVMGGFAAHRGYLELPWVMACAGAGGFLGDQFYFHLGRKHGDFVRRRVPSLERHAQRVNRLLMRYDMLVIVLIRFIYGLRTVGPAVLGMSGVAAWRFAMFNFAGAVLWAVLVGGVGFLFGHGLEAALPELRHYELLVLAVMALAGAVLWAVRRMRRGNPGHGR